MFVKPWQQWSIIVFLVRFLGRGYVTKLRKKIDISIFCTKSYKWHALFFVFFLFCLLFFFIFFIVCFCLQLVFLGLFWWRCYFCFSQYRTPAILISVFAYFSFLKTWFSFCKKTICYFSESHTKNAITPNNYVFMKKTWNDRRQLA